MEDLQTIVTVELPKPTRIRASDRAYYKEGRAWDAQAAPEILKKREEKLRKRIARYITPAATLHQRKMAVKLLGRIG